MSFSYSTTNAFLKTRFDGLYDCSFTEFPTLALLKKKVVSGSGRTINHTVKYSPGAMSAGQLTATIMGYAGDPGTVEFSLPWKRIYGYKTIDGLQKDLMSKDRDSYIDGITEMKNCCDTMVNQRLSAHIFGQGYGVLGQLAASGGVSSTTLTLDPKSNIVNFEVGMYIFGAADLQATSSASSPTYITAINRVAGTMEVASGSGLANSDYIFAAGDSGLAATTTAAIQKVFPGFDAWIPGSALVTDTSGVAGAADAIIFGCTRSTDQSRLAGTYIDGSAYTSRSELIIDAASKMAVWTGGRFKNLVMNDLQMGAFIKELDSKISYDVTLPAQNFDGPVANIGFKAIRVHGPRGVIDCYADPWCPLNYAWGFNLDETTLKCVNGKLSQVDDRDGSMIHRVHTLAAGATYNLDLFEMRTYGYPTMAIERPENCIKITMPTITL